MPEDEFETTELKERLEEASEGAASRWAAIADLNRQKSVWLAGLLVGLLG